LRIAPRSPLATYHSPIFIACMLIPDSCMLKYIVSSTIPNSIVSLTMSGTALVLHIEPGTDFTREVAEQLSPHLSKVSHRSVTDATSLAATLHEQAWGAVLCAPNISDLHDQDSLREIHANNSNAPYSFLDSLPGMACQIRLDKHNNLHFPYVSEGCFDLLGITPFQLTQHPQLLVNYLHPDDAKSFHQSMLLSFEHATPWNWEGRIILPRCGLAHPLSPNLPRAAGKGADDSKNESHDDEIKWVNLRAKHHNTDSDGTYWKGFMVNITQNKQAEIELKHSRQRLRELSSHIEHIKEEERTRIAREIHDEIGVLLTALKMDLAWLAHRLPAGSNALLEKTQDMSNLLDTAGRAANDLVHSLRPGSLDCFGIVATIEIEAREFTKRTGIPCKIIKSSDHFEVSDEQSITLFRVFQETLNNIMKHASARHIQVQILKADAVCANKCIELIVSDDGCGFDETAPNKPRSFGLRGIQERIRQLGGMVTITSKPGKGTKIAVSLPLETNG
jgi:two-component system sensor histidine kinase UhpB